MKATTGENTAVIFFAKVLISSIVLGIFAFLGFRHYLLLGELQEAKKQFHAKEAEFSRRIRDLDEALLRANDENSSLTDLFQAEKERNDSLNEEVESISHTVGILQKLSQTDKELLQKYSKVYFLNENYVPEKLVPIDGQYLYEKSAKMEIHEKVQKYLYRLMNDAQDDKIQLLIISAYRSFREQSALKSGYVTLFGSGANRFSADQGYSEHQLGSAVDFTTPKLTSSFEKFSSDPAYAWLQENAHKYGFILSYPKGNAYYQFEPWHWRFVGITLASDLHDKKQYFYDMSQREIDTYLIDIFD